MTTTVKEVIERLQQFEPNLPSSLRQLMMKAIVIDMLVWIV